MSASEIVNKVWHYAHVLRDDDAYGCASVSAGRMPRETGVGCGGYVEAALAHPRASRHRYILAQCKSPI